MVVMVVVLVMVVMVRTGQNRTGQDGTGGDNLFVSTSFKTFIKLQSEHSR